MTSPRLRSLPASVRLGLTGFILTLMIGLAASVAYIYNHYSNRDEQPKLTVTDVAGAYHGVTAAAPLVKALQRGHPPEMPANEREALLDWLLGKKDAAGQRPKDGNPRLAETYDDIDAGDLNPLDLIAKNCLSCHSRTATGATPNIDFAKSMPLSQWEDVKKLAFPKQLTRTPTRVLIISTHAHALALGTLGLVLAAMMLLTRYPRPLINLLVLIMGVGLFVDLAGWWISRESMAGVYLLLAGGAAFNAAAGLSLLLLLADLWLPTPRERDQSVPA